MRVFTKVNEFKDIDSPNGIVLTIGNFDGVHLAHQNILRSIKRENSNQELLVLTFIPHPSKILRPTVGRFLITSYEKRRSLLENLGIDILLECDFSRDFSELTPEEFLETTIGKIKKLKRIYLGHDFRFGSNKSGDIHSVVKYFKNKNVEVLELPKFSPNGLEISSSRIRSLISSGNVDSANSILGRDFSICGDIIRGQGRGRTIGVPTANIRVGPDLLVPSVGVYVTRVVVDDSEYESVTNIGTNPTFDDIADIKIETHIFNFSKDIYGKELQVCFYLKIRDVTKFNSVDELKVQISKDIDFSRKYFAKND